jgi:ketosteroid isomerase-like protein
LRRLEARLPLGRLTERRGILRPVTSANVATIRALYEEVLGPGCLEDPATVEVVPRFFADDVELLQMSSILGTAKHFAGHRGVVESGLEVVRDFADAMFLPEEVRAAGDLVGTAARFRGKGRRSGAPVEIRVGHLFTLRDGLVVRYEVLEDPGAALAAVAAGERSESSA